MKYRGEGVYLRNTTNQKKEGDQEPASIRERFLDDETILDNELVKEVGLEAGEFGYFKYTTVENKRYILFIEHTLENSEGEAEIHFALADSLTDPVTNFGLEVFGKVATEIEKMYREIPEFKQISQLKIIAAKEDHSLEEEQRVSRLSQKDLIGLEGFRYSNVELGLSIEIHGQTVSIVFEGKEYPLFNLGPQLIADLEKVSDHIDAQLLIPELLRYLNRETENTRTVSKKEIQRLKLYQYYFHKRFPQFTFNSKVVERSNGRKDIEFEKDGKGRPYLLVFTDTGEKIELTS